MELLIVIVNYRVPKLAVDCLRSLAPEMALLPAGTRVVVTDNLSGDDSVQVIGDAITREGWNAWATLQPLERNGGFAFGNNAAIRPALASGDPPDFVLLLNPDTIVLPGGIASLLAFMNENPKVGIAGSRLQNVDGTPQKSAFPFPGVLVEFKQGIRLRVLDALLHRWKIGVDTIREEAGPVDWVAGASMMIRKAVFDAAGLIDDHYFMYYEEVDFVLRARRAGWPCWYVPQSRIVHLVGKSSGVTVTDSPKRLPTYWFDARRRFWLSNHGRIKKFTADVLWAGGFAFWRVRQAIKGKVVKDPPSLLWDFVRYNFFPRSKA